MSRIIGHFEKTNWEELDYPIDWSSLLEDEETISVSDWVVPAGLEEVSDSYGDQSTTVTVAGGAVKQTYTIVNRITTSEGRKFERGVKIKIIEVK